MAIKTLYSAVCDNCGVLDVQVSHLMSESEAEATAHAEERGWVDVVAKGFLCPKCHAANEKAKAAAANLSSNLSDLTEDEAADIILNNIAD